MQSFYAQRGSIVIYSVLLLAVILTMSLGLIGIFIPKIKVVGETLSSTGAIFAADSAAELCLYEARNGVDYNDPASTMNDGRLDNGATFTIQDLAAPNDLITGDCSVIASESYGFRVVGTARGISRALEITQ